MSRQNIVQGSRSPLERPSLLKLCRDPLGVGLSKVINTGDHTQPVLCWLLDNRAECGIYKTGGFVKTAVFGQPHALVHSSVVGYAEKNDLIHAQAQDIQHCGVNLVEATVGYSAQYSIELP
jgi:hypothetical protein